MRILLNCGCTIWTLTKQMDCWWSKDELMSNIFLWTPTHGHTSVGRSAKTYIHQNCTEWRLEDIPEYTARERERERVTRIYTVTMPWWWRWWWWWWQRETQEKLLRGVSGIVIIIIENGLKWSWFKSWTRLLEFHFMNQSIILTPLGK